MKVRFREQALADIESIRRYLQARSPRGSRNVLQAIRAAVRFIAENPHAAEETNDAGVRVKVIVGYPYKIFYSIQDREIEILHIRHSARRPWVTGLD